MHLKINSDKNIKVLFFKKKIRLILKPLLDLHEIRIICSNSKHVYVWHCVKCQRLTYWSITYQIFIKF